ncbi:hypothetical protein V865_004121 [Kwoniella europaea PYCC6329]|uniref:Extracellular membrane protein CFEM domain-containing protein n=1 Tax=Kwoniella europaea PYCC6329 TaxID=1423913 RepID=A0AAX4KHQ2_9TREE
MKFAVLAALIPLLGGASTFAIPSSASPTSLISRQTAGLDDVPAACTSKCASTQEFAKRCDGGQDVDACLEICQPSLFSEYEVCATCIIDNFGGLSGDDEALLQSALGQIKEECGSLTAGGNYTSSSNSTTTDSAAISGSSTSASNSASRTLISATSIASSHASSATSAASSAASGASAAPSGNADSGVSARTAVGGVVAFIGAAVGLALLH